MSQQKYLVSARKYRPQLFQDLVAQEHVSDTLKNAIRLDRLAHAYLFSGPRGVGKTTAARILAKAINCTTAPEDRTDAAEPCRQCESCQSFEEGRSLNIIEIDAASNNKVEDIRELRETVRVPPQGSRKKVYIVDEVHMLSNAAFNALLKTLEEPPPYVLFIFATTEPHKVLPTILSRCQRFDFRRIPVPDIVTRLQTICTEESITADDASLMLVARKGDGALRDALSVFDQAVSLCGTDLRYAELAQALGVVEDDLYFAVTQNIQQRDPAGMLRLVDKLVRAGYDLQEFLGGLAEHLRNLMVARTLGDTALIEAAAATQARYAEAAPAFSEPDLLRLMSLVGETEEALKNSQRPRLKLELTLLQMASLQQTADLRRALDRLGRLEEALREGKLEGMTVVVEPAARAEAPGRTPMVRDEEKPPTAVQEQVASPPPVASMPTPPLAPPPAPVERTPKTGPVPEEPAAAAAPAPEADAPDAEPPTDRSDDLPPDDLPPRPPPPPPTAEEEEAEPHPDPMGLTMSLFGPPALQKKRPQNRADLATGDGAALAPTAEVKVAVPAAPPATGVGRLTQQWPRFVETVKKSRIHVGAMLENTLPTEADATTLTIGVADVFSQEMLEGQEGFLLEHLRETFEPKLQRVRFTVLHDLPSTPETTVEAAEEFNPHAYFHRKRAENPTLDTLFNLFGTELAW